MKKGFIYCERVLIASSLVIAAVSLMGAKSCDLTQDYFFATQAKIAAATATPDEGLATLTPTPTGSRTAIGTATQTETPEPTDGTPAATATVSPSVSITPGSTPTVSATAGILEGNIFTQLKGLDNPGWQDTPKPYATLASKTGAAVTADSLSSNWLGNLYNKDGEGTDSVVDSDNDGFTDALEIAKGTNPNDPNDSPRWMVTTSLHDLKKGVDDDLDGLTKAEEKQLGTSDLRSDTDRDGVIDGNEVASGSSPLDRKSIPIDSDGDGLSDKFELAAKLNPNNPDSDGDGLGDGLEQALGTNPFVKDSDGDGILDGKEYELNSNPMVADK